MSHALAARACEALKTHHFLSARQICESGLQEFPKDPDLWCQHLITEAYFGREEYAAQNFSKAKGSEYLSDLELLLSRYFYCRSQVAYKTGTPDSTAQDWLSRHPYQPEKGIGARISACLITKDEEDNLPACLASLKGLVDEIVVVDTGSTDRTVEIAREFGAIVSKFKWVNDFSAARNYSLSLATGDWVLWIDADETLDLSCIQAFRQGVVRPHIGGYSVQIINYLDEGGTTTEFVHCPTRLFRRAPGIQFTEPIHEQITPSLMKLGLPWTPLEGAKIHHEGYRQAAIIGRNKVERTLTMLQEVVSANPNDPFQIFNLANTYFVAHDYEKAAITAERCVSILPPAGAEYGPAAFQVWATSLDLLGKHQEALLACQKCDTTAYGGLVNEYLRATALLNLGRHNTALEAIEKCIALEWPSDLIGDKGIADFRRYGLKAQILGCLERWEESLAWFDETLKRQPDFPASVLGRALALENLGRDDEAEAGFIQAGKDPKQISQMERGLGSIEERRGNLQKAATHFMMAWQAATDNINLWAKWVEILEEREDVRGVNHAYEALAHAKELTPQVLVNWSFALERIGETEKALACVQDALNLDSTDPNTIFSAGDLLYRSARYQDAALMYEQGLRLRMDYAEGWFVLGNCMAQMGGDDAAVHCYSMTLKLDPNHEKAQNNLSVVQAA